ncbi:MAG: tetratricopeptide repeat protein [Calditrichaeota bacterium]|nr:tetratricopeptide repeat protein [Calditrichota bacterium]MCB9391904.1 tetratricopeptide repeat protein [Calditrichota bacterium]
MGSETGNVRARRPAKIAFLIALLAVPALLLWVYFAPQEAGKPTFEKLQSETESKSQTPLESMEDMWEHHPGHGPIALELANLYLQDGQYRKAIEFYNVFLEQDTSEAGWLVRLDLCRAYSGLMMTDSALAQLNRMLERDPSHAGALYNLGAIQANAGSFSAARAAWEKLIEAHPQDTLAVYAKAALPKLNKPDGHP